MTAAGDRDPPEDAGAALLLTRVGSVFAATPAAAIFSWLGAAVVAAAFWQPGMAAGLMLWLAALFLLAGIRIAAAIGFRRRPVDGPRWARRAILLNGLLGLLLGIACFWLTGIGTQDQILLLSCFVMAIAIGSFTNLAYWPAHAALYLPMFGLLAAGFLLMPGREGLPLAAGTALICGLVAFMGRSLARDIVLSMRLSIENQRLADRLRGHVEALEQANLELTELSATDPLTGLANRRRLDARLDVEWQRSLHAQRLLGLMIVDVDHFRAYNDRHGHTAGDDCLQLIAEAMRHLLRHGVDLPARYAGDQFAIILPGMDAPAAAALAERIRGSVAALAAAAPGVLGKVTVSIGTASAVPPGGSAARQLVEAADAALQHAKHSGRDRVQAAPVAM
jgi:diguanylate cyclase (GGDEF)-like protein